MYGIDVRQTINQEYVLFTWGMDKFSCFLYFFLPLDFQLVRNWGNKEKERGFPTNYPQRISQNLHVNMKDLNMHLKFSVM